MSNSLIVDAFGQKHAFPVNTTYATRATAAQRTESVRNVHDSHWLTLLYKADSVIVFSVLRFAFIQMNVLSSFPPFWKDNLSLLHVSQLNFKNLWSL